MSGPPVDARRERRIFAYSSGEHRFTHQYFPPLTEYLVSGYSWLDESWRRTGRQFYPGEMRPLPAPRPYTWGTPLRLGRDGNAGPYLADGWAAPEKNFRWTSSRSAHVQLTITQPGSDVVFRAKVQPALIAGRTRQRVEIFVANQRVGEWSVAAAGEYSAAIPSELAKEGPMEVILALPDAVEPKTIDASSRDARMLALAVSAIVLDATVVAVAPAVELGRVIPLGLRSEGLRYLGEGWSPPEEAYNWTNGGAASIRFQTPKPVSDLVVSLSVIPFVVPDRLRTQRVVISVGGRRVGRWNVSRPADYAFRLRKEWLTTATTEIRLELPDATVPAKLDPAALDRRRLGLAVSSIVVARDSEAPQISAAGAPIVFAR